jgi:hypothetical protein
MAISFSKLKKKYSAYHLPSRGISQGEKLPIHSPRSWQAIFILPVAQNELKFVDLKLRDGLLAELLRSIY